MADFNMDALAGQLMDIDVKATTQTETRNSRLATATIEGRNGSAKRLSTNNGQSANMRSSKQPSHRSPSQTSTPRGLPRKAIHSSTARYH
jgi:hypothetical protein